MTPVFVLLHSPSVGPTTWLPVAEALRSRGHTAVIPSLTRVAGSAPPYWLKVVELVTGDVPAAPLILVPHSNAGLFVPALVEALAGQAKACLFVDAALPPASGNVQAAEPEFVPFLRDLADDAGILPRWTDWWGADETAALLPDEALRQTVIAEQPRLPLDYYLEEIPVPPGWDRIPCSYLWYGDPYAGLADQAAQRGWPTHRIPGEHLHHLIATEPVTDWLLASAGLPEPQP